MSNEETKALRAKIKDVLHAKIAQIKEAQRSPAGQDLILWFPIEALAANPVTGNVTDALSVPAVHPGSHPTVRNGNGRKAHPTRRMIALQFELVWAESTLEMLDQADVEADAESRA